MAGQQLLRDNRLQKMVIGGAKLLAQADSPRLTST
jgi:hypothetical protein